MIKKKPVKKPLKRKVNFWGTIWGKLVISIVVFLLFIILNCAQLSLINKLKELLSLIIGTIWWGTAGVLVGGLCYSLFKNKGKLIVDNNADFLNFCKNSNGLVFWGPYGSGKTAIMALLAQELPEENKYASFPCNLPWMERAQIDFSRQPSKQLGVKEVIFLDEINLLFRGNRFQENQQMERFLAHFFALSRHQGTKVFINGQRLGQVWIDLREVATAICQIKLLQKIEEGIYVKCEIWQATAWSNEKTDNEFIVFISRKYLDTYNSYWLKGLKYLRDGQGYV